MIQILEIGLQYLILESIVCELPLMMIIMGLGAKSLNRVCIVVVICYLLLTWSDGGLKILKFKLRISKIVRI